jgi:hypothetical protein
MFKRGVTKPDVKKTISKFSWRFTLRASIRARILKRGD